MVHRVYRERGSAAFKDLNQDVVALWQMSQLAWFERSKVNVVVKEFGRGDVQWQPAIVESDCGIYGVIT